MSINAVSLAVPETVTPASQALEHLPAEIPAEAADAFSMGLEHLAAGDPSRAASYFQQTIERWPDFAAGHLALGVASAVCSRIYVAIDHLERAAALEPVRFGPHFILGQLYFKLRIVANGYAEMSRALQHARSLEERGMVSQVLREEKQRERTGVPRPHWQKPFGKPAIRAAMAMIAATLALLVHYLH